jgi:hypothetical protein
MSNWGNCLGCRWWQIEPAEVPAETTHGLCTERSMHAYLLRVSGSSGCGLFVAREEQPATAPGSGQTPPDSAAVPGPRLQTGGEP